MNTPVTNKVSEWIDWLRIDAAATTVESYGWELRHLEKWAAPRDVVSLSKADLARYLSERRVLGGCSDATIRRSVNALRAFYKFALGKRSPAKSIPAPSVRRKRQRTLTYEEAVAVMSSLDTSTTIGRRDLALFCLGLSTALRESELCRLKMSEIDLQRRCLTTRVKGGNDSYRVFSPYTVSVVSSWLAVRQANQGVETVFVSVGGIKHGETLTPSGLRCIFRSIGRRAGLEKGFSPHVLRRSFATLSHLFGAPSRLVQVAGGWDDIKQVEGYTMALVPADFAQYDPVSRVMGV